MCSTRLVGEPDGAVLAGAARSGYAARRAEVAELADAEDSKDTELLRVRQVGRGVGKLTPLKNAFGTGTLLGTVKGTVRLAIPRLDMQSSAHSRALRLPPHSSPGEAHR